MFQNLLNYIASLFKRLREVKKKTKKIIYLDNAATSYPKPPQVLKAMIRFTEKIGGNPGRSGHRLSVKAGEVVEEAREAVAELFNIKDPLRVAFSHNASQALNFALLGLLEPGDHVITTSLEHNSVARPLRYLEGQGVQLTIIKADPLTGEISVDDLKKAIRKKTRLVVVVHGSNVIGRVLPLRQIGEITRSKGILLLVDAAQTAGSYPIDVERDFVDLLAFTGHKSLMGPQGTGGLFVRPGIQLKAVLRGGTGSRSEEDRHPSFLPDLLEAGTLNAVGLAGLAAGVRFVLKETVGKIREKEMTLLKRLLKGLEGIEFLKLYGNPSTGVNLSTISINFSNLTPSEVGYLLDKRYGIMVRVGLHCSPWTHQTIGTYPKGTVRISLGYFNTIQEVDFLLEALSDLSELARRRQ